MDETIAIDAIHFEARDQAPAKEAKEKPAPKKRGRKSKTDVKPGYRAEAALPLYDKKIDAQLERKANIFYKTFFHLVIK